MKTYSETTRATTAAEEQWRAMHNDWVEFVNIEYVDEAHAAGTAVGIPPVRYAYDWYAFRTVFEKNQWEAWATANAIDPETGYLHNSSVRIQSGGKYAMDITNSDYLTWCYEFTVANLNDEVWLTGDANYPKEGVLLDVTYNDWIVNPAFDNLGIMTCDELSAYPSSTAEEREVHPYLTAPVTYLAGAQAAVDAAYPGLGIVVYPNFGSTFFLTRTDANALALIAQSTVILAQSWFSLTDLDVGMWPTRVSEVTYITDQSKSLMASITDTADTDANAYLAACCYMMVTSDYLYGRIYRGDEGVDEIWNWERPLLPRQCDILGDPTEAMQTSGRHYSRTFTNGEAHLYLKNDSGDASDDLVLTGYEGKWLLGSDGKFTAITGDITVSSNGGAIIVTTLTGNTAKQYTATAAANVLLTSPSVANSLIYTLTDEPFTAPDTSDYYVTTSVTHYSQHQLLGSNLEDWPDVITSIVLDEHHAGSAITENPAIVVSVIIGGYVVYSRSFTRNSATWESKSYEIPVALKVSQLVNGLDIKKEWRDAVLGDDTPYDPDDNTRPQ